MKSKKSIIVIVIILVVIVGVVWYIKKKKAGQTKSDTSAVPVNVNKPLPTQKPGTASPNQGTKPTQVFAMKRGESSEKVKQVQFALNKKFNANLVVDGKYGPALAAALEKQGYDPAGLTAFEIIRITK